MRYELYRRDYLKYGPGASEEEQVQRTRTPQKGEVLGVVDQMLGAGRMKVRCTDGKERICSVPGKFKRRLWIKMGMVVLVEPWEIKGDERGNIIYRYSRTQTKWLIDNGYMTL